MVSAGARDYVIDGTWRTMLKDLGVSPAEVLKRAGLPLDLLHQDSPRLTPAAYYDFWNAVEAAVADPVFPIRICETVSADTFTPLLFAALCSPNLLVAAERAGRHKALVSPMRVTISDEDDLVAMDLSWDHAPPPPPTSLVLKELLVCVHLGRAATREPMCPVEVTSTALPPDLAPYEEFFGAPLRQGPRHRITFTRADATRPFLTSDEAMWKAFQPALRERLGGREGTRSATERVRSALFDALPSGVVGLEEVSRRLATSVRTLQRQIEAEGSSFQHILKETRERLARHYLESTTMTAAEIALLLGYDDPNSFSRAFKAWTGATPRAVRLGHRSSSAR